MAFDDTINTIKNLFGNANAPDNAGGDVNPYAQAMLDMIGATTPGSPGTPGYMVSRQGERDAAQGQYNQFDADRAAAYGGAVKAITDRNPMIQALYDDAARRSSEDAAARSSALANLTQRNDANLLGTAASLGLKTAPAGNERANQMMASLLSQLNTNAQAWGDFNGAMAPRAIERNNAAGDAINYQGLLQQAALQQQLQAQLAALQDYWVGGSGGSAPGTLLTPAQQMSALQYLNDASRTDNSTTSTVTSNPDGTTTRSTSTTKKGKS